MLILCGFDLKMSKNKLGDFAGFQHADQVKSLSRTHSDYRNSEGIVVKNRRRPPSVLETRGGGRDSDGSECSARRGPAAQPRPVQIVLGGQKKGSTNFAKAAGKLSISATTDGRVAKREESRGAC